MRFEPKTKGELRNLLPEGIYEFLVTAAEEKVSKSQNPYIALTLAIYDQQGNKRLISDGLILIPSMQWKILAFCEATGLMEQYNAGELTAADCLQRVGQCKVVVKEQEGFDPKNEVKSYYKPKEAKPAEEKRRPPQNKPVSKEAGGDGDCPFAWIGILTPWLAGLFC